MEHNREGDGSRKRENQRVPYNQGSPGGWIIQPEGGPMLALKGSGDGHLGVSHNLREALL